MVVMDSFALPVEGTETRVNAHEQAYEYMTAYMDSANQVVIHLLSFVCHFFLQTFAFEVRNLDIDKRKTYFEKYNI